MRARIGPQRKTNGDENAMSRHVRQSSSITGGPARVAIPQAKAAVLARQALNEVTTTAVNRKVCVLRRAAGRSKLAGCRACGLWLGETLARVHCCDVSTSVGCRRHVSRGFWVVMWFCSSVPGLLLSSSIARIVLSASMQSPPVVLADIDIALSPGAAVRMVVEVIIVATTLFVV